MAQRINFKGGVHQLENGGAVKFLLFLLSGQKEISFFDGKKLGVVDNKNYEATDWKSGDYMISDIGVVKVMLHEQEFGKAKLSQQFYLDAQYGPGFAAQQKIGTIFTRCSECPSKP